jgi:positive regulator of sigma E activity
MNEEFCNLQISCAKCKSTRTCAQYGLFKRCGYSSTITEELDTGKLFKMTPLSFPKEIEIKNK